MIEANSADPNERRELETHMAKKSIYFNPQRFFLNGVPKQPDGTCYVLNADYGELWAAYGEQEDEIKRLRRALDRIANLSPEWHTISEANDIASQTLAHA